jgi:hypothetical protein
MIHIARSVRDVPWVRPSQGDAPFNVLNRKSAKKHNICVTSSLTKQVVPPKDPI